jgi:acyl-CoA thioesterase FadM
MWTEHIGRASFGFGYEVRRVADDEGASGQPTAVGAAVGAAAAAGRFAAVAGTLIASGATRHAVVARDTMRPVRIEGWIAELMARAQEWRPPS